MTPTAPIQTATETPPQIRNEPPTWRLDELLEDASESSVASRLDELGAAVARLEAGRASLRPEMPASALLDLVAQYERAVSASSRLMGYASLRFAADTQDGAALAMLTRVEQAMTELQTRTLFLGLFWQELPDADAERLLAELPGAGATADHLFWLGDLRRLRQFKLDERSEQIVNWKDQDGIGAVLMLYSLITNAFEFTPEIESERGEKLTRDQLMRHAYSNEAPVREAAYRELYRVYRQSAKPLQQMYVHRVQDWHNEHVRLRGYASPIAVRNVANDVPDQAIDAMLEAVRDGADVFHRYFRWKAERLGLPRLRRFDIYAPLPPASGRIEEEVSFPAAVELVLDTFDRFHPRFGAAARRVFDDQHVDAAPRPGKKGGAFCATVAPELAPWVLLNYTGRLRDVATLAHELGHAVHSLLAAHHSVLTIHASLPLAETASVFGELLVIERLLAERADVAAQREVLAASLDDVYATVLRQAFFVLFEREAHDAIRRGADAEQLHELYYRLLEQQFGDSVELDPMFRIEWIGIPHIYSTPFYCYAYSFGQLLVLALYRRFREEGEAFKPRYLRMLAHGGAARPQHVLEEVGVDVTDPQFWRGGLAVVEEMLARLEGLDDASAARR
ncbi:MAG TPA: M3 family oligoendopeptidase [Thermoanaerobaculia bacterium]|nr:M3 family oligoendopeptidase [Thermoanaerobaculia bacterium]